MSKEILSLLLVIAATAVAYSQVATEVVESPDKTLLTPASTDDGLKEFPSDDIEYYLEIVKPQIVEAELAKKLSELRTKRNAIAEQMKVLEAQQVRVRDAQRQRRTNWEYKVLQRSGIDENELNTHGADGWELVDAPSPEAGIFNLIFKRPKQ